MTLTFELTEEQIKTIRKDYSLSKVNFQKCMNELVKFVQDDPITFLEQLDWFNY